MKISTSKIKCYKGCRRLYYFKYIENLVAQDDSKALIDGTNYHALIEELYKTGDFVLDTENEPKVSAMAMAYKTYIYPKFKVKSVEESFEYQLDKDITLVGRFDGVAEDGYIVEHKTSYKPMDEEYLYGLQWDEQVLNYMLVKGCDTIYYTVCQKPTIRQGSKETAEQYFQRCIEWYGVDTDNKIRVVKVSRTKEEIEQQRKALITIAKEMAFNERYEDKEMIFYKNPNYCTQYNRRCIFAPICLNYKPDMTYIDFTKREENNL